MTTERNTQYPYHLAQLVAERLQVLCGDSPPESVLVRLFETLYFASFRTDEGRRILGTINYVDCQDFDPQIGPGAPADRWNHVAFDRPLPLDVRTLTKLARAADPDVSSLTVYADESGELFVWGMVDQEPRHGDNITLDAGTVSDRPGLFQATITGTGNVAVYHNSELLGNLSQSVLVEANYDVLWSGPVHRILANPVRAFAAEQSADLLAECDPDIAPQVEGDLVLRWLNSISRILVNVQHYRHGGGLIIVPRLSFDNVHVKYRVTYDRLLRAVVGLVRANCQRGRASAIVRGLAEADSLDGFRARLPFLRSAHFELEERKNEVLGASRFIAALSCVDGVVLLDQHLTVHGFGVELRTDNNLEEVYMAGDTAASPGRLREVELAQFGTRHRAMMRYCHQYPGALGFAVSQDGDIQVMTRLGDKLILWENIDVQLAFKADASSGADSDLTPVLRRLNLRLQA